MKRHAIGLSIFSSSWFNDPPQLRSVLELVRKTCPSLAPQKYGLTQPLRSAFRDGDEEALSRLLDRGTVYWKSAIAFVSVDRRIPTYMHGSMMIDLAPGSVTSDELFELLVRLGDHVDADFAAVHQLNDEDRETDLATGVRIEGADGSVFAIIPKMMSQGIPGVYWATLFGRRYVDMIGCSRLLDIPGASRTTKGLVAVRLTEDIDDCASAHDRLTVARDRARRSIGERFFVPGRDVVSRMRSFLGIPTRPVIPDLTP